MASGVTATEVTPTYGLDPAFGGMNLIEVSWLPPGSFYILNGDTIASSWSYLDWKWRFFVAEQVQLMKADLAALVRDAEQRLGLL